MNTYLNVDDCKKLIYTTKLAIDLAKSRCWHEWADSYRKRLWSLQKLLIRLESRRRF